MDNNNLYPEYLNYVFRDSNSRAVKHNTYIHFAYTLYMSTELLLLIYLNRENQISSDIYLQTKLLNILNDDLNCLIHDLSK